MGWRGAGHVDDLERGARVIYRLKYNTRILGRSGDTANRRDILPIELHTLGTQHMPGKESVFSVAGDRKRLDHR
jgi:hypothetical protein